MTVQTSQHSDGGLIQRDASAGVEFLAWSHQHAHDVHRREVALGQIQAHPDQQDGANALAQQRAWALRQGHQRRLHDSAITQLRNDA